MEADEDMRRTAPAGDPAPRTVSLERHSPAVAIVTLRGEHDLATRAEINAALARAGGEADVLVDLSDCSFIDSSVIGARRGVPGIRGAGPPAGARDPARGRRDPARRARRRPEDVPHDPRDARRRAGAHLRDLTGAGPLRLSWRGGRGPGGRQARRRRLL